MTSLLFRSLPKALHSHACGAIVALIFTFLSAVCVHADTIISNFPPINDTGTSAGLTTARVKILRFAMPAGSSYTLTSVDVRLNCGATTVVPDLSVWSDVSDGLGSQLVALVGPAISTTGLQTYTVTPATNLSLQPTTKYWLVVRAAASSVGTLDFRGSSPNITPTGIATHDASRFGTAGVTGTFANSATINTYAIFGVIANPNAMGACCAATAQCTFGSPADCATSGGLFSGDGTSCTPNICTPRGACCASATNACTFSNSGAAGCPSGTSYQGDGTSCSPNICPQGACCNDLTGTCSVTGPGGCPAGSTYQTNGTSCTVNPCPQPPPPANDECAGAITVALNTTAIGTNVNATASAALINDGANPFCTQATWATGAPNNQKDVYWKITAPATAVYTVNTCGSSFDTILSVHSDCPVTQANLVSCNDDSTSGTGNSACAGSGLNSRIPTVTLVQGTTYYLRVFGYSNATGLINLTIALVGTTGSCCNATVCTVTDAANCTGTYADGGTCAPGTCGGSGVCCRGATCSTTVAQANCTGSGTAGASFSAAAACNSGPISNAPCCYADYNKAGGISVQDIFDFLSDWFAGSPYANTGGNGTAGALTVQNIFDFLSDWFTGGC